MATEDERAEAEIVAEEANGAPFPCKPQEGVTMLQRRIVYLDRRIAELDGVINDPQPGHNLDRLIDDLTHLRRQKQDALQRLAEYQVQLKGRN